MPEVRRPEAFFHLWVVKEACIKARGDTLGPSIASVRATLEPRGVQEELSWEVIDAGTGVVAAIALVAPEDAPPGLVRRVDLDALLS